MSGCVTLLITNLPWLPIALGGGPNSSLWPTWPFKIWAYKRSHYSPYTADRVTTLLCHSFSLITTLCKTNAFSSLSSSPTFSLSESSYSSFMAQLTVLTLATHPSHLLLDSTTAMLVLTLASSQWTTLLVQMPH